MKQFSSPQISFMQTIIIKSLLNDLYKHFPADSNNALAAEQIVRCAEDVDILQQYILESLEEGKNVCF